MKVLVLTSLYPNNTAPNHGIFVHERILRVARPDGCSLRVVAPVPWYPPIPLGQRYRYSQVLPLETRDGIEIRHPRYFMVPKIGMRWHGWTMYRSLLPFVRSIQAAWDFDLIDAHYVYPDGHAATLLGKELGRPVVVSARGSDLNLFRTFSRIRPLLQWTLDHAAAVITVSGALRDQAIALGAAPGNVSVIPNGVNLETFRPIPPREARSALGLPDRPTLLFVGNLVPEKGVDRLLEIYRRLAASEPAFDAQLLLVGKGPLRRPLEERVRSWGLSDRVRFVGEVAHADLRNWYGAADILCVPSRREGWPNVILESIACGTPVVATGVGGIPEILTSPSVGTIAGDSDAEFASAVLEGLRRTWDPDALRAHAARHTWERAAESVRAVFRSVVRAA